EQSSDYYKALQTHLAANSGLDDIQGIEIGFVADVVANHADAFVDFNSLPTGAAVKSTFFPWKWGMETTKDNKTIGLGTGAGADGKPNDTRSDGVASAWKYASTAAADKMTAGLSQFSTPWNQAFANGAFAAISCPAWMLGYISGQAGAAQAGEWSVASIPG